MTQNILSFPAKILSKITNTIFIRTITSSPFKATLVLVVVVLFWSFPSYDVAFITNEMDENWASIFLQAKEPFVNHNIRYGLGSHQEKLAFRFVPALILNILHIQSIIPAFIFQFFTLAFFYYLLILVFNKLFQDRIKAFVFAIPICFVIAGHVYISDYRGIFDTLALDFLLMALLFRNKTYVIIPLLLAYYTDERALIASPALFLINILIAEKFNSIKLLFKATLYLPNIYLLASWVFYFILRFFLNVVFGLTSGSGNDCFLFLDQINKIFYTFYIGLEGFIIPFALIVFYLLKNRIYAYTALICSCFLLILFVAQSVIDINRSMSYAILILILILILLDKFFSKDMAFKVIAWVILINITYGDSYPLLLQLIRMKFITHSI